MNPILKYRGGKSREIQYYAKYIPDNFRTYLEPFFGGGATYFYLEPARAIINDINEPLMTFYKQVKSNFATVQNQLQALQAQYEANQADYSARKKENPDERIPNANEALYYHIRDMYNGIIPSQYLKAVLYFFINKTAYSGMIRYNAQGEFNVPFGRYQNFNTGLLTAAHAKLLRKARILNGDYSVVFEAAQEDDFMFLDPPYDCVFNDYGNLELANGFDEAQHRRLAAMFRTLQCRALMVIGKTPLTEELYGDYIKDEYFKSYAVNIRNRFKSEASHIIVTNY